MGFSVARSLHGRWRRLSDPARERLEPLAEDVRERALDLRGSADPERDGRELDHAVAQLADAMIDEAAGRSRGERDRGAGPARGPGARAGPLATRGPCSEPARP